MPDRSANSAEVRADQGPPVQPLIRAGRSWRAIPGHLYGLRQSALIGQLSVAACDDAKLEALDGAIAELLGDPALVLPLEMGGGGIASRFALLVGMAQSQFGHPISDGFHIESARQAADGRHLVGVALPCNHPHSARSALRWAIRSLNHMAEGGFAASSLATPARELEALGTDLRKFSISGINAVHLFQAAHQLDIPVIPHVAGVFRYGTGRHSRLLDSTRTDRTSVIGTHIARNKMATAAVLRQSGLPAPVHQIARSADEATEIANRLGYPVVVKPSDKDGGVGVFAGLRTEESLRAAFNEAAAVTAEIIVERHFEGNDYRLTVQDGCVIKVEQRVAGGVRGDGRATIAELVEREQASAHFQKILRNTGRMALHLDAEAEGLLREQGLDATSVPQKGQRVSLRRKNNVSAGGEQVAVRLEDVHPDNLALAVRAAALLQLDIAGVDLLISDIEQSWFQVGALICEVNAKPQVGVRTSPGIYLEMLRRTMGEKTRIPAHLLVVDNDRRLDETWVADQMRELSCNSLATADGVWIDGMKLVGIPRSAFESARILFGEHDADAALCIMPVSEIAGNGLPLHWFDSIRLLGDFAAHERIVGALTPHTSSLVEVTANA